MKTQWTAYATIIFSCLAIFCGLWYAFGKHTVTEKEYYKILSITSVGETLIESIQIDRGIYGKLNFKNMDDIERFIDINSLQKTNMGVFSPSVVEEDWYSIHDLTNITSYMVVFEDRGCFYDITLELNANDTWTMFLDRNVI